MHYHVMNYVTEPEMLVLFSRPSPDSFQKKCGLGMRLREVLIGVFGNIGGHTCTFNILHFTVIDISLSLLFPFFIDLLHSSQ